MHAHAYTNTRSHTDNAESYEDKNYVLFSLIPRASFIASLQYISVELNLTFNPDLMCLEPANNKEMKHLLGSRCYTEPLCKLAHIIFIRGSYFPHFANEELGFQGHKASL